METSVQKNDHPLILLGFILILTIASSFLPAKWFGIQPAHKNYTKIDLSDLTSVRDIAKDTNGDGVTDWSEIVKQTYGGADASTSQSATLDPGAIAMLNDPKNLTGSFSKNLYLASAYTQKTGVTDPATQQDIVSKLMKDEASKIEMTTYTYKDLQVDAHETPSSVKSYGNKLGKLIRAAVDANLGANDVILFKNFVDTKNKDSYVALSDKRDAADYIVSEMLTMKVPLSASPYHLLALNRVIAYKETMDNILKVETDPIRSSIAFDVYAQVVTDMLSSAPTLATYFKEKSIVFGAQEAGYVFDPRYTIPNK